MTRPLGVRRYGHGPLGGQTCLDSPSAVTFWYEEGLARTIPPRLTIGRPVDAEQVIRRNGPFLEGKATPA